MEFRVTGVCPRCGAEIIDNAPRCLARVRQRKKETRCSLGKKSSKVCGFLFSDAAQVVHDAAGVWANYFDAQFAEGFYTLQHAYIQGCVAPLPVGETNTLKLNKLLSKGLASKVGDKAFYSRFFGLERDRKQQTAAQRRFYRSEKLHVSTIMTCCNEVFALVDLADSLQNLQLHPFFGFIIPVANIMHAQLDLSCYVPFQDLEDARLGPFFTRVINQLYPSRHGAACSPPRFCDTQLAAVPFTNNVVDAYQFGCLNLDKKAGRIRDVVETAKRWAQRHETFAGGSWLPFQSKFIKSKDCLDDGGTNESRLRTLPHDLSVEDLEAAFAKYTAAQCTEQLSYRKLLLMSTFHFDGERYALVQMAPVFKEVPWRFPQFHFLGFPVPVKEIQHVELDCDYYVPFAMLYAIGVGDFIQRVVVARYQRHATSIWLMAVRAVKALQRAVDGQRDAQRAAEQLVTQRAAEQLAAQRAAEQLATQRAAEELAAQRAAEELATQRAAAQRAAEELATQRAAEELAAQRAAAQRAAEELATQRAAEELAAQRAAEELAAKRAGEQPASASRDAAGQTYNFSDWFERLLATPKRKIPLLTTEGVLDFGDDDFLLNNDRDADWTGFAIPFGEEDLLERVEQSTRTARRIQSPEQNVPPLRRLVPMKLVKESQWYSSSAKRRRAEPPPDDPLFQVLPIICGFLLIKDIAQVRLVCKGWRKCRGKLTKLSFCDFSHLERAFKMCWPSQLQTFTLSRRTSPNSTFSANLLMMKNLTALNLGGAAITDFQLKCVGELKFLQSLDLHDCYKVTDAGLTFVSQVKSLSSLDLTDCDNITDDGLEQLGQCKQLRTLQINGCHHITSRGLMALLKLTTLHACRCPAIINLHQSRRAINFIAYLVQLRHLDLQCGKIDDHGLSRLGDLIHLITLNLRYCANVGDRSLVALQKLTLLEVLHLDSTQITDRGLQHVATLRELQVLTLRGCLNISDCGLKHLSQLCSLQQLDLSGCNHITNLGLQCLTGLTTLYLLWLANCPNIDDVGVRWISSLIQLEHLSLAGCPKITNEGLAAVAGIKKLTHLDVRQCCGITTRGVNYLRGCHYLAELDLTGCKRVVYSGLEHWSGVKIVGKAAPVSKK